MASFLRGALFVDWDNVIHSLGIATSGISPGRRIQRTFEELQTKTADALSRHRSTERIRVSTRLYHGWHSRFDPTDERMNVEAFANSRGFARTIGRVSFRPEITFGNELACDPQRGPLFDTARTKGQKMVDTALTVDVLHLFAKRAIDVGVIASDDDDFLPVAFTAESWNCDVFLLRSMGRTFGKTSLIERMVYERTQDPAQPPIFHITSRGRRLSNLPDAIGKTASDLDARFRTEQVPILVRLGALQIAVDGFDELVQPDGYGNAWGALKDLIRQIGRGGPLILAGRDTFFDQQDVQAQFQKMSGSVNLRMVRLQEADTYAAMEWLRRRGWDANELSSPPVRSFFERRYTLFDQDRAPRQEQ